MMIRTSSREQVRDWLALVRLTDEVGDHLPCRQAPDLYFATQSESYYSGLAKKACEGCPIKLPCGEYAIKHIEPDGIWGGLTVGERKQIRKQRKLS